ncbi:glycerophosphodiester phosphodiesterase family protein [Cysteiniphilum halobium]|uniref:glycerophosphodiester phosphodiesterase family protein n=1 Tax=Cysteiniphilum halobium TaxID=2219059 RepID=UPI000E65D759|nr:glycerophosphodiester phosphodiesterase family protein [Cysteiniphilum halobium]
MKISKFIAHRGANKVAPENTMLAFEKAYQAGVRWIELDVQLSADNVPFIFHDNNAKKLTGLDVDLTDQAWTDIAELYVLNDRFPETHAKIPTLDEYLLWMATKPDLYTNIEVKVKTQFDAGYEARLVKYLLGLVNSYSKLHSRILLSSFSEYVLAQLAESKTTIACEFLLEVESWTDEVHKIFSETKKKFDQWGCVALGINSAVLNRQRIAQLKEAFHTVLVYSIGALPDEDIHKLLADGADSVFIDSMSALQSEVSRIGFLATGDEITTGDIINTNTPKLAEKLYEHGFQPGLHLVCFDAKEKLKKSLYFLLQEHDVVITVGGLGPTEDDKTCEAIAEVFNKPLMFNEASWQRIFMRISSRFATVPENNKKQAYFPQDAEVLVNKQGTADGCYINVDNKHLFMLPGPPHECLPMFDQEVFPRLLHLNLHNIPVRYQWQLLGASEAHIANMLSPLVAEYQLELGYRAAYPYLEVKLHVTTAQDVSLLANEITKVVEPFLATTTKQHASEVLKTYLKSGEVSVSMQKDVTKGYVYSHLAQLMPVTETKPKLSVQLQTNGMLGFWSKSAQLVDDLSLIIKAHNHVKNRSFEQEHHVRFSNKGRHSFQFIYEWICAQVLRVIEKEEILKNE